MVSIRKTTTIGLLAGVVCCLQLANGGEPQRVHTVYKRDLIQVTEERDISINAGSNSIRLEGLLPGLYVSSLQIEPVPPRTSLRTESIRFLPDGIDLSEVWKQFTGKWIRFMSGADVIEGRVTRITESHIFLQPDTLSQRIEAIDRNTLSLVSFDSLPDPAFGVSRAIWQVTSDRAEAIRVRLQYLAPGANWRAAYHFNRTDASHGKLSSEFSIENTTGMNLPSARYQLVSGNAHVATDVDEVPNATPPHTASPDRAGWYGFQRFDTSTEFSIHAHESIKVPYFGPLEVSCEELFRIDFPGTGSVPVSIQCSIPCDQRNPALREFALPFGELTASAETPTGTAFQGEAFISASPTGSVMVFPLGYSSQVTAEKVRTRHTVSANRAVEEQYRIRIVNGVSRAITIAVKEEFYGNWSLVNSLVGSREMQPHELSANEIEWQWTIPAQSATALEYTVRHER